jgi:protein-S-isoprenylcysteine O-methyltransferase Ste14
MSPVCAKVVIVIAMIVMVAIRAPHGRRSRTLAVVTSGKGPLEIALFTLAWIAGPCYAPAMSLLVALRLGPEEALMIDRFKKEYDAYVPRTKRLVPGIW